MMCYVCYLVDWLWHRRSVEDVVTHPANNHRTQSSQGLKVNRSKALMYDIGSI